LRNIAITAQAAANGNANSAPGAAPDGRNRLVRLIFCRFLPKLSLRFPLPVRTNSYSIPRLLLLTGFLGAAFFLCPAPAAEPIPVAIRIDAAKPKGALHPIWRFFGADEPNYATMKDGKKLLGELGEIGQGDAFFRAHNLLCTGDGKPALKWGSTNIYTEDAEGKPVYDWTIADHIFDTYLARGVRPFAQIGFMPEALSIHPQPYQHHWKPGLKYEEIITGWAYPPKDYDKWRELVACWVSHCVEKYGRAEVEKWYWEVWNEPNGSYWKASPEEFYKLHDYAIDGVRRALPTARVGGPHTAGSGGKFMDGFLQHVVSGTNFATGQIGTPTDFLAFHAKGSPAFVDGHVRMGISSQLKAIDSGFAKIAAVPELKSKPIVIGESDPDGCAACQGPQLGYRNGTMYSSYTAASFARKFDLEERHGVHLEGAVTWAFEFEDEPYFAGFRVLASNGIDLPVLNVFRMFGKMGGQRLSVESSGAVPLDEMMKNGVRQAPDVSALAGLDGKRLCAMVWHYHDDDLPGPDAAVDVALRGLPAGVGEARLLQYRVDQDHGNAYNVWKSLGAPQQPTPNEYVQLEKAGQLQVVGEPETVRVKDGETVVKLTLPRQAVALLVLTWE
jgi:xylan 1,4-beta-xylosidase